MFKNISTKNILLIFLILLVGAALVVTLFNSSETLDTKEVPEVDESEEITFNSMMVKADKLQSFRYLLNDTSNFENNTFLIRGKFGAIELGNPIEINGSLYNKIYFDRVKKVAVARCLEPLCDYNKDLVSINYSDFYRIDPIEQSYLTLNQVFVENTLIDPHYVNIFDAETFDDDPVKIYVQEYYGVPMKFEFSNYAVTFEDLQVNNVRLGEIMLPFNCTIDDVSYEFGWHSYYAENYDEKLVY